MKLVIKKWAWNMIYKNNKHKSKNNEHTFAIEIFA